MTIEIQEPENSTGSIGCRKCLVLVLFTLVLMVFWDITFFLGGSSYPGIIKGEQEQQKNDFIVQDDDNSTWPPPTIVNRVKDSKGRVVVSAVNCAYVDFADNFVAALERLGVTNYILVPLDMNAYTLLNETYPQHTVPPMPSVDDLKITTRAASWGQRDFGKITSTRGHILEAFLLQGLAIYYFDVDTVWLKNVWTEYVDKVTEPTFLQWDRPGVDDVCTGMIYLESHPQNLALVREWKKELESKKHKEDQYAFNAALPRVQSSMNFVHRNNTLAQFLPGFEVNWTTTHTISQHPSALVLHNNFIRGKGKKFKRFRTAGLWRPSGKLDQERFESLCGL